ncbi:uncharacterized protein JN550_000766 [Neoarthrinium moseri]|uniref:uncharacterized protein n=1 Tax=Neoarthrinium moseri TaxID=1658444 RepID=UPI001FDBD6AD|nr:uncharacterized protein JN550_000766 [Neoarthrinium moseri]KAI1876694.1 hypothetical protein JN550_000766 [Neoarthrinium moseri]
MLGDSSPWGGNEKASAQPSRDRNKPDRVPSHFKGPRSPPGPTLVPSRNGPRWPTKSSGQPAPWFAVNKTSEDFAASGNPSVRTMGKPPAYVFVVRHGNRLDAADKQWHLTSPTPYDPPLTYGGWLQCKGLGARIASILQEREEQDEAARAVAAAAADGPHHEGSPPRKKRRYNVILHSSPFLRCIQTSVAISAGLASNPSPSSIPNGSHVSRTQTARVSQVSSFSNPAPTPTRPTITTDVPAITTPQDSSYIQKSILRLDAFLGEWASPDYFEHITPPPESALMLATAKAELFRKEMHISYSHSHSHSPARNTLSTPSQLWSSPTQTQSSALDSLPKIGESLLGNTVNTGSDNKGVRNMSLSEPALPIGYTAPVPAYAISPSEPIPIGYVAHARDACVDIDYQWDSTRDPLFWGDGGVLPEEWAAMHQRFRKGLTRLIEWYSTADHPGQMVTKLPTTSKGAENGADGADGAREDAVHDDTEIENVVILVSHGAGCNALVGGITNQPVLADVPMASLTVARRRPISKHGDSAIGERAVSSLEDALTRIKPTVPELYELAMFANTEHLSGGSASVSRSSSVSSHTRGRASGHFSSALKDINFGAHYGQPRDHRSNSVNASLGSLRRSSGGTASTLRSPSLISSGGVKGGITVGSGVTSFGTSARKNSASLWTPKQQAQDPVGDPDLPMTLDFGHEQQSQKPPETVAEVSEEKDGQLSRVHSEEHDSFDVDAIPSFSSGSGLWGTPRPPDEAERLRDFSSQKRRWTVTER